MLVFLVAIAFSAVERRNEAIQHVEETGVQNVRHYADVGDALLARAARLADYAAMMLELPATEISTNNLYNLLESNVKADPVVYGSAFAFEHYAFSKHVKLYSPYVARGEDNSLKRMDIAAEAYDYSDGSQEWWNAPRKAGKGVWTQPYFDEGAGNILMLTYAVPVNRDGKPLGVVTIDVSLESVRNRILQSLPEDLYAIAVTREGEIVYHPDPKMVMSETLSERADALGRPDLKRLAKQVVSGQSGIARVPSFTAGGDVWVFFAPIPTPQWGLAILVEESDALERVQQLVWRTVLLGLFSLVIVLSVLWMVSEMLVARLSDKVIAGEVRKLSALRLWAPTVIVLAALSTFGWWTLRAITESERSDMNNWLVATLETQAKSLGYWLDERKRRVRQAASDARLVELTETVLEAKRLGQQVDLHLEQQLAFLLGNHSIPFGFVESLLIDNDGVVLHAESPVNIGRSVGEEVHRRLEEARSNGSVVIPPYRSGLNLIDAAGGFDVDLPTLLVCAPVSDGAILCMRSRPEYEFTELFHLSRIGESGEIYAIDSNAMMISQSRFDDSLKKVGLIPDRPSVSSLLNISVRVPAGNLMAGYGTETLQDDLPLTLAAEELLAGRSGSNNVGYPDYRGVPVIGAWQWLDNYGIGIIVEIDVNEAYKSLGVLQNAFSAVLVTLLLLALILAFGYRALLKTFSRLQVERDRSESLLLNILPKPIAERLKKGEVVIADRFPEITVLFSDIVGFTELSSNIRPQDLVVMLNGIFREFDAIASRRGLEKIKTIGDAYMVAAGLPQYCDDHAMRAADMALEMLEAVETFNRESGTELSIRIGLHSGSAVAGVIGTKKFAYDIWGDTVNIASRMESHGEPGKIHISEETAEHLKFDYAIEPRGAITVKGKGTMETFYLLGRKESVTDR
ncbi:MAG: adenylate/guanylate cyclase domain-containing protein [Sedimenticolaceae bacterium]|nr:adenylate/guanylate cyclase domain-containing protein [Sedimenticolaceae bacterium]